MSSCSAEATKAGEPRGAIDVPATVGVPPDSKANTVAVTIKRALACMNVSSSLSPDNPRLASIVHEPSPRALLDWNDHGDRCVLALRDNNPTCAQEPPLVAAPDLDPEACRANGIPPADAMLVA